VIAYEPVWAIGTGQVCNAKKAAEVVRNIRNLVKVLHGEKTAESVRIIYGGSVDEKTIKNFLSESEIEGFLVGGASLDHKKFAKIVEEAIAVKPTAKNEKAETKKNKATSKRGKK
jgi:triosephosphate isomerase (TIM)